MVRQSKRTRDRQVDGEMVTETSEETYGETKTQG
jgi:hypothetical protein